MAKPRNRIDTPVPGQKSLFDYVREAVEVSTIKVKPVTGTMNVQARLRESLSQAIKGCNLSRWEIAGKMSDLLDCEISKFMLDAWTAESKDGHRFPAEYLPAFCKVTGDRSPLSILAEMAGLFALPGPQALRAEIQKLDEDAKKLSAEKRKRVLFLQEMEAKQ